jgi:hypothetical protein
MEDKCPQFGNPDGMNGSCHYCMKLTSEIFNACIAKRNENIKPKKERKQ